MARLQNAAIVVEELDHRDIALRIAEHDLVGRAEQSGLVLDDRRAMLLGVGALLALLELRHDILHHLRVGEQIVLDDLSDLLALVGRERLGDRRSGARKRERHGGRECNT